MTEFVDVVLGGTFHARGAVSGSRRAAACVRASRRSSNLACGSFYALGAYFGITAVGLAIKLGMPPLLFFPVLIPAGLAIGSGRTADRARSAHHLSRDESYQLLITFGLLLMFQDAFSLFVGRNARTMDNVLISPTHRAYSGSAGADLQSAGDRGKSCHRGRARAFSRADQNRTYRARHAENRDMAEGLGVNASKIFALVFTVGCMLGTVGGRCGSVRRGIAGYGG